MDTKLEQQLVTKYPILCKDYLGDISKTCFGWGFECGDGWYRLIDDALGQIQQVMEQTGLGVTVAQIKSKFGGLRLYVDFEPGPSGVKIQQAISQVNAIINKAEKESIVTCERSGEPIEPKVRHQWKAI